MEGRERKRTERERRELNSIVVEFSANRSLEIITISRDHETNYGIKRIEEIYSLYEEISFII